MIESLTSAVSKAPPHNLEAEQSTLGSMLLDRSACDKAAEVLTAADFYRPGHQTIFDSILRLVEKNEPVDPVTICDELSSRNELEKVGGREYVVSLLESVPTAANVDYYAKIVEEKSILRKLLGAAGEIQSLGYSEAEDVTELVDRAEQAVFQVSQRRLGAYFSPLLPLVQEAWERMETVYREGESTTGMPTGFTLIDEMTSGLQPGDLVIVAARPSMGKTALALNFSTHAAITTQLPVAIFSLEMSKEQLVQRMICSQARVDAQRLRRGRLHEADWDRMAQASQSLWQAPVYIDDSIDCSAMAMRAKCRRLQAEKGLGMVVVDYMQLMRWHRKVENRNQEISEIARALKGLARELKVPVIALSQLSRQTERREDRKPILSDLRESGSIEAEADVVMLIYRPAYYKEKEAQTDRDDGGDDDFERSEDYQGEEAHIIIAKQRNGPTGTVKLSFLPKFASFGNLDTHYSEG